MNYILDGHKPVLEKDILKWSDWFKTADRSMSRTVVDESCICTSFLGIDHNWDGDGPPLLFETMVFGGSLDEEIERYSTWEEAVKGHQVMVDRVIKELGR